MGQKNVAEWQPFAFGPMLTAKEKLSDPPGLLGLLETLLVGYSGRV